MLNQLGTNLKEVHNSSSLWQTICKEGEEIMSGSGGVSLGLMTSRSLTSVTPSTRGSVMSPPDNLIPRLVRDHSPELEELQAQIEALR